MDRAPEVHIERFPPHVLAREELAAALAPGIAHEHRHGAEAVGEALHGFDVAAAGHVGGARDRLHPVGFEVAGGLVECRARKIGEDPVPVSALVPGVPADLADACMTLLSRDQATRFAGLAALPRMAGSAPGRADPVVPPIVRSTKSRFR